MAARLWEEHTHWTWRLANPVRHIYLFQNQKTMVWNVFVSDSGQTWQKDCEKFEEAMGIIAGMIERTGGPANWVRRGPDSGGHRNFIYDR